MWTILDRAVKPKSKKKKKKKSHVFIAPLWKMFLGRFQILPFLKNFVTDFSGTKKARRLKVHINMDNDRMYRVYQNKGQGSITLCLITFMFVVLLWLNLYHTWSLRGQRPRTLRVMSLGKFLKICQQYWWPTLMMGSDCISSCRCSSYNCTQDNCKVTNPDVV